jgi:hypothetical protein
LCKPLKLLLLQTVLLRMLLQLLSQVSVVLPLVLLIDPLLVVMLDLEFMQIIFFLLCLRPKFVVLSFQPVDGLEETDVGLFPLKELGHHLFDI